MSNQFIGCHVSVDCGPTIGFYQGKIKNVDALNQSIVLSDPYESGVRCDFADITLNASDILDLTMIEELMTSQTVEPEPQKTKKTKKSPTKPPSPQQQSPPRLTHSFKEQRHPYIKDGRPQVKQVNNGMANKKMLKKGNSECFDIDDEELNQDFDFEKNLALFDKHAILDDIYSGSDGEARTPMKSRRYKPEVKYRHDENVLASKPVAFRQITTKETLTSEIREYYTDTGLVIPCISSSMHHNISENAKAMGINLTRQTETFGINASQMALTVLGGSSRLHPRNAHQCPHVVIFTAPNEIGARGIATGRHMANHNVKVHVFMADFVKIDGYIQDELKLFQLSRAKFINSIKDLPQSPVDLVIFAMDDQNDGFLSKQPWYQAVQKWCKETMAPIMYFCPKNQVSSPAFSIKWSISCILPPSLPPSYGMLYLLDLGLPSKVFSQSGIKYRSPFCSKTAIALHRNQK